MSGLEKFFYPASVAVVGASRAPGKAGNTVVANILEFGFGGDIYPINPGATEILGRRAYPDLSALPRTPELVIAVLPREKTLGLVSDCARNGVKNVIIPAAGFSDAGDEGRRLEDAVMAVAREAGITVMGPNSIGTVCTAGGLATSIVTLDRMREGDVSLFGQTGMFSSGIARWIETEEYFGVAKIACLGNKAGVEEADLLEYLASDGETKVIGVYTEGIRDGRRFAEALSRAVRAKPVLVLKSGRTETGIRAISSHTGALAGSDAVFSGLVRQTGAVRVGDFEEMFDLAKAFAYCPLPRGNGLGVVSITGVGCVLSADAAGAAGLVFPPPSTGALDSIHEVLPPWAPVSNPADIWAGIESSGAEASYDAVAHTLADDPAVHSLVGIFTLIPESRMDEVALFGAIRERHPDKPMAAVLMAGDAEMRSRWKRELETALIPSYPSPERAVRAIAALWRYSSHLARG
jgi:acyl-CoA synthetase (NDP forming)